MVIFGSYGGVKLLELVMKIVERVLERQMRTLINFNGMRLDLCQEHERSMEYLLCGGYSWNITRNCKWVLLT